MIDKFVSQTAVIVVAAFAIATLGATAALAQNAQTSPAEAAGQIAKPSPYQGVSKPPASDVITTSEEEPPAQSRAAAAPASPQANPTVSKAAPASSPLKPAELKTRPDTYNVSPADPDAEIVTSLSGPENALPQGTVFRVNMLQEVMASDTTPGTPFRAKLSQDLVHNGRIVVPMGSELRGKVIYTSYGRRIGGQSVIHLRADEFILPDGTHYHLHAQVIDTQGSNTKPSGEGNIAYRDNGKHALAEVAVGSGGGALSGALIGGPAGAAVGTAVGAGIMGAHWLMAEHSADLPLESTVVFSLTDPMYLNPTRD